MKDLNLLEKDGQAHLSHVSKLDMIERIKKDTMILREQGLMDYSLFLIEIDRNK